jgi:3-phenylpropionate/trans-cinnamate dioxygenase ferredoxin reductase subunit
MASFVIVGAGQSGATAAGTLREEGFDGRIVLVGEDPLPPYERPPLSKEYLRGEQPLEQGLIRPERWYEDNAVELRLGARVERIDVADRTVIVEDEAVPFDAVLIATGSRNRALPVEGARLPGVFGLRSAADAARIREAASNGHKAVLVGMGFIGAEVAASLRQLGLDVEVVEFAETPLQRVLGTELGQVVEGLHRDHGVVMHFGESVDRFEGQGRFEAILTSRGRRIEGDLAVVGVGVEPVTDVVAGTEIAVEGGVLVDETLATGVPGVFAAGDVARHAHPVFGSIRVEHFDNALKMGETAAHNMLGRGEVFDDPHWFWSDQYDADIQMSGFATAWDRLVVRGSMRERSFAAFMLQGGVLRSAFSMNWPRDVRRSMPLIAARISPDPSRLADPGFDLRELIREGEAV